MLRSYARCLVIIIAVSLLPVRAFAQLQSIVPPAMYGTIFTKFEPTTTQGQLVGCQLSFSTLIKDHTYRQGQPTRVSGSIGIQAANGVASGALKVVVEDLVLGKSGVEALPSAPYSAHLRSATGANSISSERAKARSDTPGGLLIVYRLDQDFIALLGQLSTSETLAIVFNRQQGSLDVAVDVDFSVTDVDATGARKRSREPISAFLKCAAAVLQ